MTLIAYLDEFGHIGPYLGRYHEKHNDSPVFGLAGFVLPAAQVRSFGTWFYQRKCELLHFEIKRTGKHPAQWEKKGASLYTAANVEKYPELRQFTNRLLNKIKTSGGFVFYTGLRKPEKLKTHRPNSLYASVLQDSIVHLNDYCMIDCGGEEAFLLTLGQHTQRSELITRSSQSMFNPADPMRHLIEPPFQVESHRYQTMQAADWIAGLIGRFGAYWTEPEVWPEFEIFCRYFEDRLLHATVRSAIRHGLGTVPASRQSVAKS